MNRSPRAKYRVGNGKHLIGVTAVVAVLATALGGCGVLNGSGDDSAGGVSGASGASATNLEQSTITVGIYATPSVVSAEIAQLDGLFQAQGLTVRFRNFASGPAIFPALSSGAVDISFGNYVNFFTQAAKGTLKAKIVADGTATTPSDMVLLVPKNSTIRNVADLAGKKISVQSAASIAELMVRSLLSDAQQDPNSPHYLGINFPAMTASMRSGQIDASVAVEPYITQAKHDIGATVPFPLVTSATTDMPIAGYLAGDAFIAKAPKTVAAFQRAIVQAQDRATRTSELVRALPPLTKVDPALVPALAPAVYPTSLDPNRLQRVITLMRKYSNQLTSDINAQDYLVPLKG